MKTNPKIIGWAFDEKEKDTRDWVAASWVHFEYEELPDEFIIEDSIYVSQDQKWYKMSCSAQATINAANWSRRIRRDNRRDSAEDLRDIMLEKKLASEDWWAYLIDAIKQAKEEAIIQAYYQTNTLLDILNALYATNLIITGSNKINWDKTKDWLVKDASSWYWHAFAIIGWDKHKQIWNYKSWALKCKNSYWKSYQDKWCFWIPFDLVDKVLFNTKKSVVVVPEWTKYSREERYEKYLDLKEKYDRSKTIS